MNAPSQTPQRGNKQVLLELFHESIGLESGLARTARALWREPSVVLRAYLENEKTYISPYKVLLTGLSLWVLVNSFILDWYAIWGALASGYMEFLLSNVIVKETTDMEKARAFTSTYVAVSSQLGGDLFSKFYVPMVVTVIPLSALFVHRSCEKYGADFRSLVATNSYVMGSNAVTYLVITTLAAISIYALLVFATIALVLIFLGINIFILIPPRRFFVEHGKDIERKLIKGNMMAVAVVILVLGLGYWAWIALT